MCNTVKTEQAVFRYSEEVTYMIYIINIQITFKYIIYIYIIYLHISVYFIYNI